MSGTNGKTTTTRLLAVALGGPVVTNATGSNMPAGHVAALCEGESDVPVVLEVDEGYLPALLEATAPRAVVLLNLSRDQLDRTNEVRMLAGRWRRALAGADRDDGGGQRRRPARRLGRGIGAPGGVGGRRARLAARRRGLPVVRRTDRVR